MQCPARKERNSAGLFEWTSISALSPFLPPLSLPPLSLSLSLSPLSLRGLLDEEGYHGGTAAIICRHLSPGKAVDMSEDHKPTNEAELSWIRKALDHVGADGRVNGGLNLFRAIGEVFSISAAMIRPSCLSGSVGGALSRTQSALPCSVCE